jgi:hypothetical protein
MRFRLFVLAAFILVPTVSEAAGWKAGVASHVITPAEPMWLAGYANRNKPAEGKEHDLYVKALALEDPAGGQFVLLTADLIGVPRSLGEAVALALRKKTGLPRERLMLTISHTHCGPALADNLSDMYLMPESEASKVGPYTDRLREKMIEVIVKALDALKPATLSVGKGTARFAVNRRKPTPKGVVNDANPGGPVDHDVPVLRVESDGKLLAVAFGYACHNTTMQYYRWSGDYAGFAQIELQQKRPGTTALFWAGCGGDANPLPRSKIELCRKYGKELAEAVDAVLESKLEPITGTLAARYSTIALPFDSIPDGARIAAGMLDKNRAIRKRAERFKKILDAGGKIDDQYRYYPVQVVGMGDQVLWVALGGEVVVDYSRRLKKELAGKRAVWVTGYANDVMAYIPSARVLKEGGYEADSSQIYYGMPSKWSGVIEERIVTKVHELAGEVTGKRIVIPAK